MGRNIKKGIGLVFSYIKYFVIEFLVICFFLLQSIVETPWLIKIGLIGLYSGIIWLAVNSAVILWILLSVILLVAMALALIVMLEDKASQKRLVKSRRYNPFFEGMSVEQAQEEYKRLMKKYHPNKRKGDFEKTQAVVVAYNQFCREHHCR